MIGKKIKTLREMKNLTQAYMAEQLNISQVSYSKLESEDTELTVQRLEKIAEVLGLPATHILAFDSTAVFNASHSNNYNFSYFNHGTYYFSQDPNSINQRIDFIEKELHAIKELLKKDS